MRSITLAMVGWLLLLGPSARAATPPEQARQVLQNLTREEKVAQLFLVYHSDPQFMAEQGFGGSLVMESMVRPGRSLEQSLGQTNELAKIPLLVAIDQEGGQINRIRSLRGFADFPSAAAMALWSPDSVRTYVRPMAARLRGLGINLNLAPVLDPSFDVNGQPTLMNDRQRSFGRGSGSIVPAASAFMAGCADEGVLCVVKHFPGYVVATNSDLELAESSADRGALLGYVHPFAACLPQAGGVMMTSILFNRVSDRPAVFDTNLVAMARCGLADRLVMTDDLWGTALRAWVHGGPVAHADYPAADLRRLTLLAFDAGNDMLMITYPAKAVLMKEILVGAIKGDPVRQARLDESVYRILLLKARLGLFEIP